MGTSSAVTLPTLAFIAASMAFMHGGSGKSCGAGPVLHRLGLVPAAEPVPVPWMMLVDHHPIGICGGLHTMRLRGAGRSWIKKTIKQARKKEKQRKKRNIDNTNLRSSVRLDPREINPYYLRARDLQQHALNWILSDDKDPAKLPVVLPIQITHNFTELTLQLKARGLGGLLEDEGEAADAGEEEGERIEFGNTDVDGGQGEEGSAVPAVQLKAKRGNKKEKARAAAEAANRERENQEAMHMRGGGGGGRGMDSEEDSSSVVSSESSSSSSPTRKKAPAAQQRSPAQQQGGQAGAGQGPATSRGVMADGLAKQMGKLNVGDAGGRSGKGAAVGKKGRAESSEDEESSEAVSDVSSDLEEEVMGKVAAGKEGGVHKDDGMVKAKQVPGKQRAQKKMVWGLDDMDDDDEKEQNVKGKVGAPGKKGGHAVYGLDDLDGDEAEKKQVGGKGKQSRAAAGGKRAVESSEEDESSEVLSSSDDSKATVGKSNVHKPHTGKVSPGERPLTDGGKAAAVSEDGSGESSDVEETSTVSSHVSEESSSADSRGQAHHCRGATASRDVDGVDFADATDFAGEVPGPVHGRPHEGVSDVDEDESQRDWLNDMTTEDAGPGTKHLVTATRNNPVGFGIMFDVAARGASDVYVTGLRTGSHAILTEPLDIRILTSEGGCAGKEADSSAWGEVSRLTGFQGLPKLWEFEPKVRAKEKYGAIPLDNPIHIKAGQTMGICIQTNHMYGIVLRALKRKASPPTDDPNDWNRDTFDYERIQKGDVTDEDANLALYAGKVVPVPISEGLQERDRVKNDFYAFCGVIDYSVAKRSKKGA